MPQLVAEDFPTRLAKAGQEVRDRYDAWQLALEQRDELVVQAIDTEGMTQSAVAAIIKVQKGRISAILAGSQPEAGAAS